jgi:hypothetical protein
MYLKGKHTSRPILPSYSESAVIDVTLETLLKEANLLPRVSNTCMVQLLHIRGGALRGQIARYHSPALPEETDKAVAPPRICAPAV